MSATRTLDEIRLASEEEPYAWLLEHDNPSARYLTLRDLLDSGGGGDADATRAQAAIPDWPPVRRILDAMDPIDFWGRRRNPFYGGAIGTHAIIDLLAELGLPSLAQAEAACENLLEFGQREGGGFAHDGSPGHVLLCNTGISIRTLVYFGFTDDERVGRAVDFLVSRAATRDGLTCPFSETGACQWGITKALGGFAALPASHRTPDRLQAIACLADSLLNHKFDFEGRDANWLTFGFPLDYKSDLVELCDVLSRLGYGPDPRFETLMSLVLNAATDNGRWIKEYGTRAFQVERRGSPSKWITIRALRTVNQLKISSTAAARSRLRGTVRG